MLNATADSFVTFIFTRSGSTNLLSSCAWFSPDVEVILCCCWWKFPWQFSRVKKPHRRGFHGAQFSMISHFSSRPWSGWASPKPLRIHACDLIPSTASEGKFNTCLLSWVKKKNRTQPYPVFSLRTKSSCISTRKRINPHSSYSLLTPQSVPPGRKQTLWYHSSVKILMRIFSPQL